MRQFCACKIIDESCILDVIEVESCKVLVGNGALPAGVDSAGVGSVGDSDRHELNNISIVRADRIL